MICGFPSSSSAQSSMRPIIKRIKSSSVTSNLDSSRIQKRTISSRGLRQSTLPPMMKRARAWVFICTRLSSWTRSTTFTKESSIPCPMCSRMWVVSTTHYSSPV
jgi:hypothetical protein